MADFGKINLASMESYKIVDLKDDKGNPMKAIVLPIEKNNLFLSKEGNVYLDLVIFKRKEPFKNEDGAVVQTHLVKQSLPKEVREAMSDEEKRNQPIIGNMCIWEGGGAPPEPKANKQDDSFNPSEDDLPF